MQGSEIMNLIHPDVSTVAAMDTFAEEFSYLGSEIRHHREAPSVGL